MSITGLGSGGDVLTTEDATLDLTGVTVTSIEQITTTNNAGTSFVGTSAANTIVGGSGADTFTSRGGADVLTGNGGADRFVYTGATDSSSTAMDTITDFLTGTDVLDFTGMNLTGDTFTLLSPGSALCSFSAPSDSAAPASGANQYFVSGGIRHAAALYESGADSFVMVDANNDGAYTAGSDVIVKLTGASGGSAPTISDIQF